MKKRNIFRIVGILLVCVAIFLFIVAITHFGDDPFEPGPDYFMIGMMTAPFVLIPGIFCLVIGFSGALVKASLEIKKEIQEENKEILTDIANTNAEIYKGSVGTIAKEVAENLTTNKIFCKHCGASIDNDSKFCSKCGKEL